MALKKCKECGKEVSTSAKTCPHCGVSNPTKKVGLINIISSLVGIIVFIYLLSLFSSPADESTKSEPTTSTLTPEEYIKKVANCKECYVKVNYDSANKVFNSVEVHFNGSAGVFSPGSYTPKSDTFDILENIYTRSNYPVNAITVYVYLEFINPDGTTYRDRAMRTKLTKAKADKIDWNALSSNVENLPRYVDSFWMHRSLYVYG